LKINTDKENMLKNTKNITFEQQNLTSLNDLKSNIEMTPVENKAKCKIVHGLKDQEPISNNNSRKYEEHEREIQIKTNQTNVNRSPSFNRN
jgi:hypothetical protein